MREQIKQILHIQDVGLLDELANAATVRTFQKGADLLRIGDYQRNLYFLLEGVVRCHLIDGIGRDFTDCFLAEYGYPIMTATLSIPSLLGYTALTPVRVLEFPMSALLALMNEYTELLWAYNAILQKALLFHWEIKNVRAQYDAKQRYLWFRKRWPYVDECAKSKYIASFLAMTPETLSRVRSQVRESDELPDLMCDSDGVWTVGIIKERLDAHAQQTGEPIYL